MSCLPNLDFRFTVYQVIAMGFPMWESMGVHGYWDFCSESLVDLIIAVQKQQQRQGGNGVLFVVVTHIVVCCF